MNGHFQLNAPDVTYESFDAEVLVINLRTGTYYSLRESAVSIWQLAVRGVSSTEIARKLAQSCHADEAATTAGVGTLLNELESEALLVTLDALPTVVSAEPDPSLPTVFIAPVFDRYADMQQLLLIDPIHEVDATGWPNVSAKDTR